MADKVFYWIGQAGITANVNTLHAAQTITDPYFLSTANYWNNKSNWAQRATNYGGIGSGPLGNPSGGGTNDGSSAYGGPNTMALTTASRFPVQGDTVYFRGMTASIDGATAQRYPLTECLYGGISGDGNWEGGTSDGGITTGHGLTGQLHKLVIDDSYNYNLLFRKRDGGMSGNGQLSPQAGCQGWGFHRFGVNMTDQAGGTNANFKVGGWMGLGIASETYISNRGVVGRKGSNLYGQPCSLQGSASSRSTKGLGHFADATTLTGKVNINELYVNANDHFIFNQPLYGPGCTLGKVYIQRMVGLTADWPMSSHCSGRDSNKLGYFTLNSHHQEPTFGCGTFRMAEGHATNDGGMEYDGYFWGQQANMPGFLMYGHSDKYQITTLYRDTSRNTYYDLIQSSTPIPNVVLASQSRNSFNAIDREWDSSPPVRPSVEIYADVETLNIYPQAAFSMIGSSASIGNGTPELHYMGRNFVTLRGKWNNGTQAGVSAGIVTLQDYNPYYHIEGHRGITNESMIENYYHNRPSTTERGFNNTLQLDASAGGTVVNLKVESGIFIPWSGDNAEDTTICTVMDGEIHGKGEMICHDPLTNWPGFEISGYTTGQDAPHGYGMLIVDTDATLSFQAGQKVAVHGSSGGISNVLSPSLSTMAGAGGKG